MPFCTKCGAELNESEKFCHQCGAKVRGAADDSFEEKAKKKFDEFNNQEDITSEFDAMDIAENKGMSVLAYLSWLVIIPLCAASNSKFARFHSNQGLILAIGEIILALIRRLLSGLFVFNILLIIAELFMLLLAVIGIVNAANGKAKALPVIGRIKLIS